jgi:F plasmid transfer operon, TraF, protein
MAHHKPLCAILILLGLIVPAQAMAVEFAIVGPRAAGMGGAGVAVTTDSLATYWNPAGLAMTQTVDIRAQVSIEGVDRRGILDTIKDIEDFDPNAPNAIAQAQGLRDRINNGGSLSAVAAGGLYFKGHLGEHAFGFNLSDVATAGTFVSQNFTAIGNSISGQLALRGLEARQASFSYAYAFADKTFSVGVTGKVIQGAAYTGIADVTGGNGVTLSDDLGKAKLSTAVGIDVGAIYRPSSWLRFGAVAKDINQPEFDARDGTTFKLVPQIRGGIAINPYSSLTLTGDVDVTSNKTLVPGQNSQMLSLGAEQTILSEFLSLRVGAFKNMQDAASPITPTAGLGLRIFAFRADVGGGYDFRERGVLGALSLSLTF